MTEAAVLVMLTQPTLFKLRRAKEEASLHTADFQDPFGITLL